VVGRRNSFTSAVDSGVQDVNLCSAFLSVSTLASIIQQIHYAIKWRAIKTALYNQSQKLDEFPSLAFVGVAEPVQVVTYIVGQSALHLCAYNLLNAKNPL
jgi:hypothetical protein